MKGFRQNSKITERIDKERTEFAKYANASFVEKCCRCLTASISIKNTEDKEKFLAGVKILFAQFYSALQSQGLKPIKTKDEKFDPFRHEVLMKEASTSRMKQYWKSSRKGIC